MLPAGPITEQAVEQLNELLEKDDVIIDGGNSFYKDDIRRGEMLAKKGIHYIDCGTSGGVWGLERGFCMMIGGHKEAVDRLDPHLLGTCARRWRHREDSASRNPRSACRQWLHACRADGFGPFREDGP